MASPVERFEAWMNGWIEKARKAWGEPLYRFFLGGSYETIGEMSRVTRGGADLLEESLREQLKPILERLRETEGLPDDMKAILDKATEEPGWIHLAALMPYAIGMLMGVGMSSAAPLGAFGRYFLDSLVRSARLDPMSVITAWRRDPAKYAALFDDLKDQGWSDERMEALKFYTLFYPGPRDLIGYLAHEVYEDDIAARYGLDAEIGEVLKHIDKFEKAGMDEPRVREAWRDHWEHASWMQVVEMLHRGLLAFTEVEAPTTKEGWASRDAEGSEVMYDWFRLVEIPLFWRKKLEGSSWNVPTRVDVRRWWDMRTISEDELYNIYHRQGYHGKDLENYVLWTKVYTAFPDLIARWSKGWITEEDVRGELVALGMPADRVEEMLQTKKKAVAAGKVEPERDLTKSEIYTGVKKGVITREEGIELLEDLNYTMEQAEYILDIRVAAAAGSPETPEEFRDLTQKWRRAASMPFKPVPEELKRAAAEVVRLTKDVEALMEALETEERGLISVEPLPEAATKKREELRVTLHRAEAELQRVKTEYDSLVAQWRYGE